MRCKTRKWKEGVVARLRTKCSPDGTTAECAFPYGGMKTLAAGDWVFENAKRMLIAIVDDLSSKLVRVSNLLDDDNR
jgi:hypothetical protein